MNDTWIWIVIFIAVVIGSIIILQVVLYFFMKRAMKKAYTYLDGLVPVEKERYQKIKNAYFTLNKTHYISNDSIKELIKEQEVLSSEERVDMQKLKGQNDFLVMFLLKFMKEKKLKMKDNYSPIYKELESISYFESKDKSTPYYKYNKAANVYNALATLSFVSSIFRKKDYYRAPIL